MDIGWSPVPRSHGLSKRYVPLVVYFWNMFIDRHPELMHEPHQLVPLQKIYITKNHNPVCTVTTIIQKCLWFTQMATSGAEK